MSSDVPTIANATSFKGAVNIAKRLCCKERTDGTSGFRFKQQDDDGECESGWTKVWSPENNFPGQLGRENGKTPCVFPADGVIEDDALNQADGSGVGNLWSTGNDNNQCHLTTIKTLNVSGCQTDLSSDNDTKDYTGLNTMGMILGQVYDGNVKAATVCQSLNSTQTGVIHFGAELPDGYSTSFSLDVEFSNDDDLQNRSVGTKNGDRFLRMAAGYRPLIGNNGLPLSYGNNPMLDEENTPIITNEQYGTNKYNFDPYMTTIEKSSSSDDYEYKISNFNRDAGGAVGPFRPIGAAKVFYQKIPEDEDADETTSDSQTNDGDYINLQLCSEDRVEYCYTAELCKELKGSWNNGNDCANDDDCYSGVEGYGYCENTDDVCSNDTCNCNDSGICDGYENCKWGTNNKCGYKCKPSNGSCPNCGESECIDNCFWNSANEACRYGSNMCDPDNTSENACCNNFPEGVTFNLVQIPDAFRSSSGTDYPSCLPNIFTASTEDSALPFDGTSATENSDTVRSCTSDLGSDASTAGTMEEYIVNCADKESNCYPGAAGNFDCGDDPKFRVLQLTVRPECFFADSDESSVFYNTKNTDQDPSLYAALLKEVDDTEFGQAQSTNNQKAMWYTVERLLSWIIINRAGTQNMQNVLGMSTLMNSAGVSDGTLTGDDGFPLVPLNSVDDLEKQLDDNEEWARTQPLLFYYKDNGVQKPFFATIEDIYHVVKQTDHADPTLKEIWDDSYLQQINQFVYSNSGTADFGAANYVAKNGLGSDLTPTDVAAALDANKNYTGTLDGSMGHCQTVGSNDILTYGGAGISATIVAGLIVAWSLQLKG